MRLERLDLTRYGHFTDKSLTFAQPTPGGTDLHIVYGGNEAGKSTLFSAWLDLLFGIPLRSRYDFLHPGPTMQIGAELSHAGSRQTLRRLKRSGASLFDRHDAPLPEASLQAMLGGLSREGYAAMFSLDDETLEKGGDGILASRGDLGEMLFSASAGLAGLAPGLEAMRSQLDRFHRSGKRSGWLYDAKKQLADLDRQRRDLEVSASALQKLTREAGAAEEAWRAARADEEALQARLDQLARLESVLPLTARIARLEDQLQPIRHLPDASAETEAAFMRLGTQRRDLAARIRDRALRLQGLQDERDALPLDSAVLAQAGAIDAAEALRPDHDSASKDIPRRLDEADEARRRLEALMAQLGQQQGAAPAELCLGNDRIAALRGLLAQRSGLLAALAASEAEARKANDLMLRERERLAMPDQTTGADQTAGADQAGGPARDTDEAALEALVARLRQQDPAEALARAQKVQDQTAAELQTALAALTPWQGDGKALAALAVPQEPQLARWEKAISAADDLGQDARREATALRGDLARLQAETADQGAAQAATGITLAKAAAARSLREKLWAAHLADLSAASARQFEAALREDDQISALLAEAIAGARREALAQAVQEAISARLHQAEARLAGAIRDGDMARAEVAAAGAALGLTDASPGDLAQWLLRRNAALTALAAQAEAQTALQRCNAALVAACQALETALPTAPDAAPGPAAVRYETLLSRAIARIGAAGQRREARQRLQSLTSDLRERIGAAQDARAALETWKKAWQEAAKGSILAGLSDGDAGHGTLLDLLDQLGNEVRAAASLQDRIEKMQANRQRFVDAKAAVLQALQQPSDGPWADLMARLRRAGDHARDHERLSAQITQEQQQDAQDQRALAACTAEMQALAAPLGWQEEAAAAGGDDLASHIAACRKAAMLRHDIAALQAELADRPAPGPDQDAATLRQDIARLQTDHQLLRDETERRLAVHLEARQRLDAIDGDDALARIAASRETLLLDMRERTSAHLADRFGLIALETGLRRFRDQHRSTMLSCASETFRQLSCGAYSGLAAQPDGSQEVLVALSAAGPGGVRGSAVGGGAKLASAMSKGTRFQLYLALRIAGYHELAQSRPTVPFIADDIMEPFDDQRSAAAFSLLADMSRLGQVIYLTHHQHLCDIARKVCPEANVIALNAA
ncbi:AAA family ATPase [Xinfangfangia sp. D13-10-4-6]|uniref:ATP-binding protein n=1 Tax=Pseudogemmobacter hezensis TaxID=2737662 RepID=UPI001553449F|nr:YhaN family protein [Pseudogemmobacter hezensis]NPD17080.1 AAA family ATPase [Pseudogemmobacter hezensis]